MTIAQTTAFNVRSDASAHLGQVSMMICVASSSSVVAVWRSGGGEGMPAFLDVPVGGERLEIVGHARLPYLAMTSNERNAASALFTATTMAAASAAASKSAMAAAAAGLPVMFAHVGAAGMVGLFVRSV